MSVNHKRYFIVILETWRAEADSKPMRDIAEYLSFPVPPGNKP